MTTARLGFDVDSTGLKEGKRDLDALVPAAKKAEAATEGMAKGATDAFRKAATEASRYKTEADKLGKSQAGDPFKEATTGADQYSEELLELRNRFNPLFGLTQKYEQELKDIARAERLAALSAEEAAAARNRATAAFRGASAALGGTGGGIARFQNQIQNASFQIGDFATQVGAGTSAAQALGQQLPQLAGGFGVWGAAVGAAVAIAVPLGAALLDIGNNAASLEDQIEDLADSIDALRDAQEASRESLSSLREEYGRFAEQVRKVRAEIAELAQIDSVEDLENAADDISESFGTLDANLSRGEYDRGMTPLLKIAERVENQLDLSSESAREFANILVSIGRAEGPEAIAKELERAKDALLENVDSAKDLEGEAAKLYRQLTYARNEALSLAGAMDETTDSTNAAVVAARNLAGEYDNAYQQFQNIVEAEKKLREEQRAIIQNNADFADDLVERANAQLGYGNPNFGSENEIPEPEKPRVARSRGGSRGISDAQRELERQKEAYDRVTESLEHQIRLVGQDESAQRAANEARRAGVSITSEQGAAIAALVYDLEALEREQKRVEEVNRFVGDSFANLFSSAITGAESFKSSLSGLLDQLSQMAINQGFQPIVGNIGQTAVGGLFSSVFGVGATPNADGNAFRNGNVIPFAQGGIVSSPTMFPMSGGRTGLMGEAGEEGILPLKRGKDGKLGVTADGLGGGESTNVNVTYNIDARNADHAAIASLKSQLDAMKQTFRSDVLRAVSDRRNRSAI